MNAAHLHLLLNHAPVFGVFFALALLGLGRFRRSDELTRVGLVALVVAGLAAAMLTGDPAEHAVEHLAGVSERAIHAHEEAAELAAVVTYVGAILALAALVLRRRATLARRLTALALAVALAAFGLMARTANLGGQIRHPEIAAPSTRAGRLHGPRGHGDREGARRAGRLSRSLSAASGWDCSRPRRRMAERLAPWRRRWSVCGEGSGAVEEDVESETPPPGREAAFRFSSSLNRGAGI